MRYDGGSWPAGSAWDQDDKRDAMKASLRTVAELVAEGLFALRRAAVWEFEMRYPELQDWEEFLNRPTCGGADVDSRRVREAFARPGGEIVSFEENLALVYTRTSGAA